MAQEELFECFYSVYCLSRGVVDPSVAFGQVFRSYLGRFRAILLQRGQPLAATLHVFLALCRGAMPSVAICPPFAALLWLALPLWLLSYCFGPTATTMSTDNYVYCLPAPTMVAASDCLTRSAAPKACCRCHWLAPCLLLFATTIRLLYSGFGVFFGLLFSPWWLLSFHSKTR